jgi:hypothetical protein
MYEQLDYGVMKSGSYNTSSSNSRIRVLVDRAMGSRCIAMGDDSVGEYVEDAVKKFEAMGHRVKMYDRCSPRSFEFCSHRFKDDDCYLENWPKSLYRLLGNPPNDLEQLAQFLQEVRGCPTPMLMEIFDIIVRSGWMDENEAS